MSTLRSVGTLAMATLGLLPRLAAAQGAGASATTNAQTTPSGSEPSSTGTTGTSGVMAPTLQLDDGRNVQRFGRSLEHSVGFRFWVWNTPAWEVGLFVHIEPGWSGPVSLTMGPEYVYRKNSLDIVLGLQYTGLSADPGFFRGRNETDVALERTESRLWVVYANALFLWTYRFNDWFEFQGGAGVGLGYVGGDLFRTQAYRNPPDGGQLFECRAPGDGTPGYCGRENNHYPSTSADGTPRFAEPRLTDNPSGSIPPVVPWVSIPHLSLHFRPHRYLDVRLDGGFAVVGFYGGLATHFIFD